VESAEDVEGAVLEKIYLYEKAVNLTNYVFQQFIKSRVSPEWETSVVKNISKWISQAAKS
jgi:hypothetical protein